MNPMITWNAAKTRRELVLRLLETAEVEAASCGTDTRELLRYLAAAVEADARAAVEDMTTNVLLVAAAHHVVAPEPGPPTEERRPNVPRAEAPPLLARLRNPWILIGASVLLVLVASMSRQRHPQGRLVAAPIALPVDGR
jgi:hypothetical protein